MLLATLLLLNLSSCGSTINTSTPNEFISLSSLYPWINDIKISDIAYITSKEDVGSLQPNFFNAYNIYHIAKEKNEINNILYKVKDLTVKKEDNPHWAGGSRYELTFKLNNGNGYTLTSYFNGFSTKDGYYVYDSNRLPSCSMYYGRQFVWYSVSDFKLYLNNDEISDITSGTIQSFLYNIVYTIEEINEVKQDENLKGYVLKSDEGIEIELISNKVFNVIMNKTNYVCTIQNEKEFTNLINNN